MGHCCALFHIGACRSCSLVLLIYWAVPLHSNFIISLLAVILPASTANRMLGPWQFGERTGGRTAIFAGAAAIGGQV